jgi:lipopolysaccharide export system permease protein
MKISPTLSAYLARSYLVNFLLLLGALLAIVCLFDAIEILRRAAKQDSVSLSLVFEMVFLKMPKEAQILFPFAILYSAMFSFWQLTRRYELIVVRSAGFSFWQFLAPIIGVAALIGFLQMTVISPLSSVLISKYDQMEHKYLTVRNSEDAEIALFREGLWLRQSTSDGYVILHSPKIAQAGWTLQNPMVLFFTGEDSFLKRIDAQQARLEQGRWLFENVTIQESKGPLHLDTYSLPTSLTPADVEDSFSSPASMSFWRLPAHIQTLEETGFDSSRLRVYYQGLLAQPLLFASMIFLAAAISLRPPRTGRMVFLFMAGIFLGFVVFFMSSFLQALGIAHQIPVVLAAWSPALISMLLGLTAMMNLEDG